MLCKTNNSSFPVRLSSISLPFSYFAISHFPNKERLRQLLVCDTNSRESLFFRGKFYYHGATLEVHGRTGWSLAYELPLPNLLPLEFTVPSSNVSSSKRNK
jgi:hypothetical protein